MQSSTWRALGNTYVVAEADDDGRLEPADAVALARDADGVIEVLASSDERVEIAIWNPDGSRAELSGNGTRIAAAWLTARSGAERIEVVVGERSVITRILEDGVFEQDLGEVTVAPLRDDRRLLGHAGLRREPARRRDRRSRHDRPTSGRSSRRTRASPTARTCRWHGSTRQAGSRPASGSGGWVRPPRRERAPWPSPRRPTARATSSCASRAGISAYASRTAEHGSTAPPSACLDSGLRELDEPAVRIPEIRGSTPRVVPRLDEEAEPVRHAAQRTSRRGRRRRSRSDPRSAGRRPVQQRVRGRAASRRRPQRSLRPASRRRAQRRSGHGRTPTLPRHRP